MNIKRYKPQIVFSLIALAFGAVGGWITMEGMPYYKLAEKPPLTPPDLIFPIVWTILYILMGIAMGRVWQKGGAERGAALGFFIGQLAVNALWSFLFFGFRMYLLSFFWLLLLLLLVYRMTVIFKQSDALAAKLQIPYLLWTAFAGYLNLGMWWLNR